jgi:type IV pilus assembly protein PilO
MAISIDDLKNMSPQIKALLSGLIILLISYLFWFLYLDAAMAKRSVLDKQLADIQQQIKEKEVIAKQKQKYIEEVKALKELLNIALAKLPEQKEIPGLFLAVAEAGKEAGVDFILFEPKAAERPAASQQVDVKASMKPSDQRAEQKPQDVKATAASGKKPPEPQMFYEEIPVRVTVHGGFHNTAVFFDKVAKLSRIVNIFDINMGEGKDVKGRGRLLNTSCVIKTYMFLEKKDAKTK